ncbi:MAG: hypothetical protein RL681_318 [Candidatus Parcubacteria bacterium]|jgi:hypothetical protein
MSDMPAAVLLPSPDDRFTKRYVVSDREIIVEGRHWPGQWPADVEFQMKYGPTVVHGDLIQHYLKLVSRKVTVILNRRLPVRISVLGLPTPDAFLSVHDGRATDDVLRTYWEARGLALGTLRKLQQDFPLAFRE